MLPGGTGTTSYLYEGNTTRITDPAGKWKRYTTDGMGNLVKVEEPDPQGGANLETLYTYNVLNKLKTVSMTRAGTTQTRTFTYDANQRLQSSAHPESGTRTYTYNSDNTISLKTDAKSQRVEYSYDGYKRITQIRRYTAAGTEDVCQQVNFYYDLNPFDAGYSTLAWGRVAAVQYFVRNGSTCINGSNQTVGYRFTEFYRYTQAGLITAKRIAFFSDATWPTYSGTIPGTAFQRELLYSYNTLGQHPRRRAKIWRSDHNRPWWRDRSWNGGRNRSGVSRTVRIKNGIQQVSEALKERCGGRLVNLFGAPMIPYGSHFDDPDELRRAVGFLSRLWGSMVRESVPQVGRSPLPEFPSPENF